MADEGLFTKEEAVIATAEGLLAAGRFDDAEDRGAFADLLKNYQKLFKTTRRFMRLSDRNERQLNAMADKQRLAAEQIAVKNEALETLSNKLAKYLSPQVYASIFSGAQRVELASQRKKLTVFFSDIAGFTEITDKMESEDLTQLINHYLTEMSRVALEHGATIDKYIGDAIMIFFGDPESRGVKEDALACVEMAIAMQKRVATLGAIWRDSGIEQPLACRIGIHTGYCTVGNFGSADRMDYTIIGGAVNLASRLEQEAESGGILITYETYAQVKDLVHCEEVGHIQVKGIAYPIATYRVVDLLDNLTDGRQTLRVELPHLELAANIGLMSAAERDQAARALEEAMTRLLATDGAQRLRPRAVKMTSGQKATP